MRLRALAALSTLTALAGCALPVERPGRLGMAWIRSENPVEGAKLVLGRAGTDDVRLMLTCQPHSGEILLTLVSGDRPPAVIELHSDKIWGRYGGAGLPDEGLGYSTQVRLQADDPVLRHVADTGKLTVVFDERRIIAPNAFAPAHDFLLLCAVAAPANPADPG